jgi:recombinational DNA repair ATPase RecF
MTLFALCAPVWFRSSRLTYIRGPPSVRVRFSQYVIGVGRQEYVDITSTYSRQNAESLRASSKATRSSASVSWRISGTKAPPNSP